jgi:hypothetical protein
MGRRSQHHRVLRSLALVVAALMAIIATPLAAEATNTWPGAYRKWPWKAGSTTTLTTLPGQCPHCSSRESSSSWKAIDAAMDYDTVYSVAPGSIDATVSSSGGAGMYLRVKDADGTYLTYEHLSKFLLTSGSVVAGQPIAVSGNSGNSTGPHLHFQRHDGTSFSSNALSLVPISGRGGSGDALRTGVGYVSDNAGIGFTRSGEAAASTQALYRSLGGYNGAGVTADINDAWTPCHADGVVSTSFRYTCAPRSGVSGSVQTYRMGSNNRERAFMTRSGTSTAVVVYRGILYAYTRTYNGHDWIYWLGYPAANRYLLPDRNIYQQDFQFGYITFAPSSCVATVYLEGSNKQQTTVCD